MSLTHDIIKMKYVEEGYLPNYPFHMISDSEMCDAFIQATATTEGDIKYRLDGQATSYFRDNYPCVSSDLGDAYAGLVNSMMVHIEQLKQSTDDQYVLPDWIYSYMLGAVVGPNSEIADIHDLLVLLGKDNIDDIFTPEAASACLKISTRWVSKISATSGIQRNPTIFGEPHVIKQLRLAEASNTTL